MASLPNQKTVIINKEPCGTSNLYAKIKLDALKSAMIDLSRAEFQMWLLFAKNQNMYEMDLYEAEAERWGIKKSTYHRAITTLINKKYLVRDNSGINKYQFYEMPEKKF